MAMRNSRMLGSLTRRTRRSLPTRIASRPSRRYLETIANQNPGDVLPAELTPTLTGPAPPLGAAQRDPLLEDLAERQDVDPSDRPARLPRAVQAAYLKPLKRKPKYGIPSCNLQLRSYSVRNLEFFTTFALRAAYFLKLPALGPVPLPKHVQRWTVPRGHFVHKKSQENFERITLRRLIQIQDGHPETIQIWLAYLRKRAYYAVGMKANVWAFEPLGLGKEMDANTSDIGGFQEDLNNKFPNQLTPEVQAEVDNWLATHDVDSKYSGVTSSDEEIDLSPEPAEDVEQPTTFDQIAEGPVLSQTTEESDSEDLLSRARFAVKIYDWVKEEDIDHARQQLMDTIQDGLDTDSIAEQIAKSGDQDIDTATLKTALNIAVERLIETSRDDYMEGLIATEAESSELPSQEGYGLLHLETATTLLQTTIAENLAFLDNQSLEEEILASVDEHLQALWIQEGSDGSGEVEEAEPVGKDGLAEQAAPTIPDAVQEATQSESIDLTSKISVGLEEIEHASKETASELEELQAAQLESKNVDTRADETSSIATPTATEAQVVAQAVGSSQAQVESSAATTESPRSGSPDGTLVESVTAQPAESTIKSTTAEASPTPEDSGAIEEAKKEVDTPPEADPSKELSTEQEKEAEKEDANVPLGDLPKTPS